MIGRRVSNDLCPLISRLSVSLLDREGRGGVVGGMRVQVEIAWHRRCRRCHRHRRRQRLQSDRKTLSNRRKWP